MKEDKIGYNEIENEIQDEYNKVKRAVGLYNALLLDDLPWEENEVAKSAVPFLNMTETEINSKIRAEVEAKHKNVKAKTKLTKTDVKARRKSLLSRLSKKRKRQTSKELSIN